MTTRRIATFVLAALLCPSCARALFGLGGKRTAEPPLEPVPAADAEPPAERKLPGMGGGTATPGTGGYGNDSSAPPPAALPGGDLPTPPAADNAAGAAGMEHGLPAEVVIKGGEGAGSKLKNVKPPLRVDTDPFEAIRPSLAPDEPLLLAESPFTVNWRRTYPEFLASARVVEPFRATFSERPGIIFSIRAQLGEVLQRPVDSAEAGGYQWSLTIADEEGRVFQHYEGSKDPPEELVWTGQNDQGEWIRAGRSYSAVYMFTDSGGSPRTKVGKPVQFTGIAHQESNGLHIGLDSSALFGTNKASRELEKGGAQLLRAAADLVKRRYSGIPIRVQAFASTPELAGAQAGLVQEYLLRELMIMPQHVTTEYAHAQYSEQRVEIVLLNR